MLQSSHNLSPSVCKHKTFTIRKDNSFSAVIYWLQDFKGIVILFLSTRQILGKKEVKTKIYSI